MKLPLICISFLLFTSCSLFESTPTVVLEGQRAVYQSVITGEEHTTRIIDTYVSHCKKASAYHVNYVFQLKVNDNNNTDWDKESKRHWNNVAEENRDASLKKAYGLIDKHARSMRNGMKKRNKIALRLIASVYNYLSTHPIEVDSIPFWIDKLKNDGSGNN